MRRIASIAAASLNSTPWVAALPVATMMDIGVARPSAQGQAMISTATALISPYTQLGSWTQKSPGEEGHDGDGHHSQHEVAGHHVGQRAAWVPGNAGPGRPG